MSYSRAMVVSLAAEGVGQDKRSGLMQIACKLEGQICVLGWSVKDGKSKWAMLSSE